MPNAFIERPNIDRYVGIDFDPHPPEGMNFATGVSQRDACEILNLNSLLIRPAVDVGLFSTKRGPANAIMHPMSEVLALARDIVTAAELAPRIGVRENNVRRWIANNLPAVGPAVVGWPRAITLLELRRIRVMA